MNYYEVAEDAYLARAGTVSTNGIGAAVDAIEPLIRADERERIAQAIEEFASHVEDGGWYITSLGDAFRAAARIARNGGE